MPVSYTHLDVYKRQRAAIVAWGRSVDRVMIRSGRPGKGQPAALWVRGIVRRSGGVASGRRSSPKGRPVGKERKQRSNASWRSWRKLFHSSLVVRHCLIACRWGRGYSCGMAPIWGRYGPFFLYGYSVVLGLGVMAALAVTAWRARRKDTLPNPCLLYTSRCV